MRFRHSIIIILALLLVQSNLGGKQNSSGSDSITIRFDYTGAQALLDATARSSMTDADMTKLLDVRGVKAMVDNVTRYSSTYGVEQFRSELRVFTQTGQSIDSPFGIGRVFRTRQQVQSLLRALERNKTTIISQMLNTLHPYEPHTGPLPATVYFIVGGSSDGFVLDRDDEPALFVALDKASGDLAGVQLNMTHELYHVMQKAAAKRVPALASIVRDPTSLPAPERLLATTMWEGTANYAADALRAEGSGPYMEMWRSRYTRNAEPGRIKENFALFDTILADLRGGNFSWDDAQRVGFNGDSDARIYFVGYEMAKAIEHYRGASRIGELLEQSPAAFFQEYITLYRQHPDITAHFASGTEAYCQNLR